MSTIQRDFTRSIRGGNISVRMYVDGPFKEEHVVSTTLQTLVTHVNQSLDLLASVLHKGKTRREGQRSFDITANADIGGETITVALTINADKPVSSEHIDMLRDLYISILGLVLAEHLSHQAHFIMSNQAERVLNDLIGAAVGANPFVPSDQDVVHALIRAGIIPEGATVISMSSGIIRV